MIPCEFIQIPENSFYGDTENKRSGKYHRSSGAGQGMGSEKWLVAAYIKVDHAFLKQQGLTEQQIIAGCLEFFNQVKFHKKKSKKRPKEYYEYGFLEPYSCDFKLNKEQEPYILAILTTTDQENKNFWGEGKYANANKNAKNRRTRKSSF